MPRVRQAAHKHHKPRVRFELGGFEAEGIELRLSRGRLLYTKTIGPFPAQPPQVIHPSEDQWQQFWQEVDRIGVWTWLPEYINPDVLDGTQWSLSLSHAGRKMDSEGSNACPGPGPFTDLLRALVKLTGHPELDPRSGQSEVVGFRKK